MKTPAAFAAALGVTVAAVAAVPGQAQMHHADGFDASRAMLEGTPLFDPYYVEETESLEGALRDRVVGPDTRSWSFGAARRHWRFSRIRWPTTTSPREGWRASPGWSPSE